MRSKNPIAWLLVGLVRAYQLLLSPLLGPTCRYYPSCSAYAIDALKVHGVLRGTWLATRRLLRCHPWSPGGVDHVPPVSPRRSRRSTPVSSFRTASAAGTRPEQGA